MRASLQRMAIGVALVVALFLAAESGLVDAVTHGDCRIKGNISWSGERIYHLPGGEFYNVTRINAARGERWFCTEAEARAAGWRRSMR